MKNIKKEDFLSSGSYVCCVNLKVRSCFSHVSHRQTKIPYILLGGVICLERMHARFAWYRCYPICCSVSTPSKWRSKIKINQEAFLLLQHFTLYNFKHEEKFKEQYSVWMNQSSIYPPTLLDPWTIRIDIPWHRVLTYSLGGISITKGFCHHKAMVQNSLKLWS